MINFRYHVVSIVAVFLALAIGIVLGAGELQGTSFDLLKSSANSTYHDLQVQLAQNKALHAQVNSDEVFAQTAAARLLPSLLAGQRVVIVTAPGAPGSVVSGLIPMLRDAGATITGQVSLQRKLFDSSASNQQYLTTIVQTLAPSAPSGFHMQGTTSPLLQAAGLLGSAILTKNDPASSQSASESADKTVLATYGNSTNQLITTTGQPYVQATLAVVVAPATPPSAGGSAMVSHGLVTVAEGLARQAEATVMVDSVSGSAGDSAIAALRSNGTAAAQISSVDDANTVIGQIISVWALAHRLAGHKTGSYGFAAGSGAAAPSPAPSPSPSASATSSPTMPPHTAHASASRHSHG